MLFEKIMAEHKLPKDDDDTTLWKLAWINGRIPILDELFSKEVIEVCNAK